MSDDTFSGEIGLEKVWHFKELPHTTCLVMSSYTDGSFTVEGYG